MSLKRLAALAALGLLLPLGSAQAFWRVGIGIGLGVGLILLISKSMDQASR